MVSLVCRSGFLYPYLHTTNLITSRHLTALVPAAVNSRDSLLNQRKSARSPAVSALLHGTCVTALLVSRSQLVRFSLDCAHGVCKQKQGQILVRFDFKRY